MPDYSFKPGAIAEGMTQAISWALDQAAAIYSNWGYGLTVTEIMPTPGSGHVPGSLHYSGRAADLRTSNLAPQDVAGIAADLRSTLGSGYRVLVESDHIHVQALPAAGVDLAPYNNSGGSEPAWVEGLALAALGVLVLVALIRR